ncbi:MAG: Fe2+-dependent dioxygenase [Pseudomonadota bacterium]|nr:Fe2+-dependent dioxygenase [Pseudomonadota bacterium]
MLLHIPHILDTQQVQDIQQQLANTEWQDGTYSSGAQASHVKQNQQLPTTSATYQQLADTISQALQQSLLFQSAALPKCVLRPLFNCYQQHGQYGNHVDNALQRHHLSGERVRTDLSVTIFLSAPDTYQGGELVIEDTYGSHAVKLNAGDAILYPSTSLHRVEPVTEGQRLAAVTWVQSLVKDNWQRDMLFQLDMSILKLRQQLGDHPEILSLTHHYHNLIRQWSEI